MTASGYAALEYQAFQGELARNTRLEIVKQQGAVFEKGVHEKSAAERKSQYISIKAKFDFLKAINHRSSKLTDNEKNQYANCCLDISACIDVEFSELSQRCSEEDDLLLLKKKLLIEKTMVLIDGLAEVGSLHESTELNITKTIFNALGFTIQECESVYQGLARVRDDLLNKARARLSENDSENDYQRDLLQIVSSENPNSSTKVASGQQALDEGVDYFCSLSIARVLSEVTDRLDLAIEARTLLGRIELLERKVFKVKNGESILAGLDRLKRAVEQAQKYVDLSCSAEVVKQQRAQAEVDAHAYYIWALYGELPKDQRWDVAKRNELSVTMDAMYQRRGAMKEYLGSLFRDRLAVKLESIYEKIFVEIFNHFQREEYQAVTLVARDFRALTEKNIESSFFGKMLSVSSYSGSYHRMPKVVAYRELAKLLEGYAYVLLAIAADSPESAGDNLLAAKMALQEVLVHKNFPETIEVKQLSKSDLLKAIAAQLKQVAQIDEANGNDGVELSQVSGSSMYDDALAASLAQSPHELMSKREKLRSCATDVYPETAEEQEDNKQLTSLSCGGERNSGVVDHSVVRRVLAYLGEMNLVESVRNTPVSSPTRQSILSSRRKEKLGCFANSLRESFGIKSVENPGSLFGVAGLSFNSPTRGSGSKVLPDINNNGTGVYVLGSFQKK